MFVVLGYRDIRIKERIPSTTSDDPFREHHLQNNPNGISDFKPLHQWRFFRFFGFRFFRSTACKVYEKLQKENITREKQVFKGSF